MRLSKVDIARRHLEAAIDLHTANGDFVAVVTLAGAAEEVLGNILARQSSKNMIGHLVDLANDRKLGLSSADVANIANRTRNSFKHAKQEVEDVSDYDPGEAVAMLARATVNYQLLTLELTPKMESFGRWLVQEWLPKNDT